MSSRSASPKHTRKAARQQNEASTAKVARRLLWQQIIALICFVIALCGAAWALQHSPQVAVAADPFTPRFGNDGYFSGPAAGAIPMRSPVATADGARKVLFGRSGSLPNAARTVESGDATEVVVDGKYLLLGKGPNTTSDNRSPKSDTESDTWAWSQTTTLAANEVLLWADDVVTSPFTFATTTACSAMPCNAFDSGTADTDKKATYESNVATVSRVLGSGTYYSDVELDQVGAASQLSGVCAKGGTVGCGSGFSSDQSTSIGSYRVFPLSTGDMAEYFNASNGNYSLDDAKRQCSAGSCNNSALGFWLRSASWNTASSVFFVSSNGIPNSKETNNTTVSVRPALRLQLDNLLLSARSSDQNQSTSGDVQLTFVDSDYTFTPTTTTVDAGTKQLTLAGTSSAKQGTSPNFNQESIGWKLINPDATDGSVVSSGSTRANGNVTLPSNLTSDKTYKLYVWGQDDGSATDGWSNKATEPQVVDLVNYTVVQEYTVTYDLGSNSAAANDPGNPTTVRTDELPVTLKAARLSGYRFDGWYTDGSFTGSPVTEIPSTLTSDITYYAKWEYLGPDGYFDGLLDGATPVADAGFAATRRVLFGKGNNATTYDNKSVSGGYKTLAKGPMLTEQLSFDTTSGVSDVTKSSTTSVLAGEALLWAEDTVTSGLKFDGRTACKAADSADACSGAFDSASGSYQSTLAKIADDKTVVCSDESTDDVAGKNYSLFEQLQMDTWQVEGVCTSSGNDCTELGSEPTTDPVGALSTYGYRVFPLSVGDLNKYFNHTSGGVADSNLSCKTTLGNSTAQCDNGTGGFWLRTALWGSATPTYDEAYLVEKDGKPGSNQVYVDGYGLRPALRLGLGDLVLSAQVTDQSQGTSKDLQLTFVNAATEITSSNKPKVTVAMSGSNRELAFTGGTSNLANATGWGWKLVDTNKTTAVTDDTVVASGKSNDGGNKTLPSTLDVDKSYVLYYWHQKDGTAADGWSNEATKPLTSPLYLVKYDLDGGNNDPDNPVGWVAASAADIALKPATKSGYKFEGWYENEQFTSAQVTTIPATSSKSYHLYAKFTQSAGLGPDGYFDGLQDGATPVADANSAGVVGSVDADGFAKTRRILFGKQKDTTVAEDSGGSTFGSFKVSGGYKTLVKGPFASAKNVSILTNASGVASDVASSTTSVDAGEVLLWADDAVTGPVQFDDRGGTEYAAQQLWRNVFDSKANSYQSNLAKVADADGSASDVAGMNYSVFEQSQMNARTVQGVCTAYADGCNTSDGVEPDDGSGVSGYAYKVFPLSLGDTTWLFGGTAKPDQNNHVDPFTTDNSNLICPGWVCSNSVAGNGVGYTWLRTPVWDSGVTQYAVNGRGAILRNDVRIVAGTGEALSALRPAVRVSLGDLVLSAQVTDQSQGTSEDLQLTFVDDTESISIKPLVSVVREGGKSKLKFSAFTASSTTLGSGQTGWGWKLVDDQNTADVGDDKVVASGKSNDGGNVVLPDSYDAAHGYTLYYWGQQDGSATNGWSNKATEPVKLDAHVVHYKLYGGTNDPDNPVIWFGPLSAEVTLKNATRAGSSFYGWYEKEDYSGTAVTSILAGTSDDVTLHAKWDLDPSTSLPYTGSWSMWWWLLAGMALMIGISTVIWRSKSMDGFAVGHSLSHTDPVPDILDTSSKYWWQRFGQGRP
ncbi:InlB B-repeat-containing protein [Bifidobacterium crudilactis]|uniref:InlB B-repeat-containing protein n=1 Tax=Bifidobacterium crudilactis TaxID=327277 RepID=UPI0026470A26|nr:InlB B-repeat-containing protein [Bifidobacterium crudilactis]MDN5972088.1 InlB B-repeat-containing protein [Bifidobacterium crudilactis]MDN5999971.1 InlB B-repeat-containing protein [Bifidobacterium crudilactis]MDN6466651.1 InlB B-repeat-containing protein [Bifidobacterium crudilactis]MDN6558001.1 InlB B-repeat-containing protein [Bifidobacterium crudilactis]MDN6586321.1 InlB B-repeat-containing protein [Bifidobacterium crudilactis]